MDNQIGTAPTHGAGQAFSDAWEVVRSVALDPVGQLAPSYQRLPPERALAAGAILCVASALACTIGAASGVQSVMGGFMSFGGGGRSASVFVQALFACVLFAAVMIGASFGVRRAQSNPAPLAADVFTVGVALLPLGFALLLGGLLGAWQLVAILSLLAFTCLVLVLHTGFTAICSLPSRTSTPAVALMIAVGLWVTQALM